MPDWVQIVNHQHEMGHADDEYELATMPGVSADLLDQLADRLGITLPEEFRDFYMTFNGFGVVPEDNPDDVSWFFQPLEDLPGFIESKRSSFADTHADLAVRFFPFIDWANGDSMGYLTDAAGIVQPGFYCFEHESYAYNADQEADEFISAYPVTIEEFLGGE